MHRLVRRFVVAKPERNQGNSGRLLTAVLHSLHERVGEILENEGNSFEDYLDIYGPHHRAYVMHAAVFTEHYESHGSVSNMADCFEELRNIYKYTGRGLDFYGMVNESVDIWRRLL